MPTDEQMLQLLEIIKVHSARIDLCVKRIVYLEEQMLKLEINQNEQHSPVNH